MTVFSFSDFSSDDNFDDEEQPYDEYLTVKGFLETHYGDTGKKIYQALERRATKSANDIGGLPGIVFNADGGEFVSFSEEPEEGFDVIGFDEEE
jgi:hypothetical protein